MQTLPSNPPFAGTFRAGPLVAQLGAACMLAGLLTVGVATLGHWAGGSLQVVGIAVLASASVWLAGSVGGLLMLNAITGGQLAKVAFGVLISSAARMLGALALGLLLYFVISLDGRSFWAAFLLTGLFCLMAETAWALRTINAARATPGSAGGAT